MSLVEVVVVTVIIGILTSTLLVGIQSARESARKSQCTNHLRQIGLAVQTYENSRQYYPTGVIGVLMDGSVREFAFDIDQAVFRAFGRRNETHLPLLDL
jgi:type II secretory pathway pseudopilin PulG